MTASRPFDADILVTHREFLHAVARRLVDEGRAEDVVQETCVRVLERLPMSLRSPRRWLARVVTNVARKTLGREGQRPERERRAAGGEDEGGGEREIELLHQVASAVRALPQPYKTTVYLRYYRDLGPREIAARQEVSVETVKSRLRRGLGLLRADLDARHGDRQSWCLLLTAQLDAVHTVAGGATFFSHALVPGVLTVKVAAVLFSVVACVAIVVLATEATDPAPVYTAPGSSPASAPSAVGDEVGARAPSPLPRTAVETPAAPRPRNVVATAESQLTLHVVDAEGSPVEGARVGLLPELNAISDADGGAKLAFPEVADGQLLGIRAEGFLPFRGAVSPDPGQPDLGTFTLMRGGRIRGRVEDSAGVGIADVTVTAAHPGETVNPDILDSILRAQGIEKAAGRTDGLGEFVLEPVAPGSVRVWAGKGGAMQGASPVVQVRAGEESERIVIRLEATPGEDEIAGIVLVPAGASAARMRVWSRFQTPDGTAVQTSPVADNGLFRVAVRRRVPHDLWVSEDLQNWDDRRHVWTGARALDGYRGIIATQVPPGTRDLVLAFEEAPSFEVQVIGPDGSPISPFDLGVIEFDGEDTRIEVPWFRQVETGARVHVPAVGFHVVVSADGFDRASFGPFYGTAPDPLRAELTPLPSFCGRVVGGGAGISGARVEFFRKAGSNQTIVSKGFRLRMNAAPAADGLTDKGGEFALTLRQSGSFFVRATAPGWSPAEIGPLEIDHRTGAEGITVALSKGGAIEGRVLLPAGMSAEGWIVGVSRGDPYGETAITSVDGRFRFESLTPGAWKVQRLSSLDGTTTISSGRSNPWTSNCRVEEGETTRFDLDFRAAGFSVLEGRLVITGGGYPGMAASLRKGGIGSAIDGETVDRVPVNPDGTFSLAVAEAGTYVLVVRGGEIETGALSVVRVFELDGGLHRWDDRIDLGTLAGRLDLARIGSGSRPVHVTTDGAGMTIVPIAMRENGQFGPVLVPAGPGTIRVMSRSSSDPTGWPVLAPAEVRAGEVLEIAPDRR